MLLCSSPNPLATLIALAVSGPDEGALFRALANSMDGSDGLLELLFVVEETKAVAAYQIQNKLNN